MTVLITSIGSNTAISVVKGLRLAYGSSIKVVGTDLFPANQSAGSAFVDAFYQITSARDTSRYESDLLEVIRSEKVECVIPIHDLEINIIAELSLRFPTCTFWAVNNPDVIRICNNKVLANREAEKAGLNVPQYSELFSGRDSGYSQFPAIVKRLDGVSSKGMFVVNSKREVENMLQPTEFQYMIQQFIDGEKEYTVDCYNSYHGDFLGGVARERVETKEGMSTKGITVKNELLLDHCKKFLSHIKFKGASNLQFIVKDAIPYFIEINPRFSGGGVLTFKANFNSPSYTIAEARGERVSVDPSSILYGISMTRFWEEVFYDKNGHRL